MDSVRDYRSNKTTFAYDADSNLVKTTEPATAGVTDTFTYDAVGTQLTATTAKGSTTLGKFTYTRDGASRVATATTTGIADPAQTFGYDQLGRLTRSGATATPVTHSYDPDGNLTGRTGTTTQAFDDAGQLCWQKAAAVPAPTCGAPPTGATTYAYNSSGDRISATPATGTATTYGYDAQHNLTKYGTTATYKYDATNLRVYKKVGTTVTKLVWDRSTNVPALLADGSNRYIYGPDGLPLEQISNSGTVTFLHHDQIGSTRLLTSSTGATVGTYGYDAFGANVSRTGTVTTPLQFAGQYADGESGLLYMRARSYDPATGQFLTRDPIEDVTRDPYAYANGDPVNGLDPSGLICIDPTGLTCDFQEAVSDAVADVGDFVYDHAGTVSTVASVGAFIPVVNVVATPVALLTGGLQAYKDVRSGNYTGAALNAAGVITGGAGGFLARQARGLTAEARGLYANETVRGWVLRDAARKAQRARLLSLGSFAASSALGPLLSPEDAYGARCPW